MSLNRYLPDVRSLPRTLAASLVFFQLMTGTPVMAQQTGDNNTTTPIKHVIVIIGETRSFDHVFATYQPRHGQLVWNLLSEGIINADGTPGPNFSKGLQM
jgi:phospholipase C